VDCMADQRPIALIPCEEQKEPKNERPETCRIRVRYRLCHLGRYRLCWRDPVRQYSSRQDADYCSGNIACSDHQRRHLAQARRQRKTSAAELMCAGTARRYQELTEEVVTFSMDHVR